MMNMSVVQLRESYLASGESSRRVSCGRRAIKRYRPAQARIQQGTSMSSLSCFRDCDFGCARHDNQLHQSRESNPGNPDVGTAPIHVINHTLGKKRWLEGLPESKSRHKSRENMSGKCQQGSKQVYPHTAIPPTLADLSVTVSELKSSTPRDKINDPRVSRVSRVSRTAKPTLQWLISLTRGTRILSTSLVNTS